MQIGTRIHNCFSWVKKQFDSPQAERSSSQEGPRESFTPSRSEFDAPNLLSPNAPSEFDAPNLLSPTAPSEFDAPNLLKKEAESTAQLTSFNSGNAPRVLLQTAL